MSQIKDYLEFPVDYVYKIIGENTDRFLEDTLNIFREKNKMKHSVKISKNGNFKSITVYVRLENSDELEFFYGKIKELKGLKYHL
jgi:putative lipoic acid-binding regulatory protein